MTTSKDETNKKICIVWDWHVDPPELFSDKQEKLQAWRYLTELGWDVSICVMSENFAYHTVKNCGLSYHSFINYHTLQFFLLSSDFDFILSWGSIDRPIHRLLLNKKSELPVMAYQFAGGIHDGPELELFDIIFTQNLCDKEEFEHRRFKTVQVFGVDKEFFSPNPFQEKNIEFLYPASFCAHKRNEIVAERHGSNAVLCGKFEDMSIVNTCKSFGSTVLPQVNHAVLRELYRCSKRVIIPATLGSQRTVAEAISCGVKVECEPSNWKCAEILEGKIKLFSIPEMAEIYKAELLNLSGG